MARKSANERPFNNQSVQAARAIDGKKTEYRIEGVRGLVLVVLPSDVGTYYYRYTVGEGSRRKFRTLKLGRRDAMTLHDARRKCEDHRREVENGGDPVGAKEARAEAMTFRQLAEKRLDMKAGGLKGRTPDLYREMLERDAFPTIGDVAADEVTSKMIGALLDKIEARSPAQADKTKVAIASVYKWGRGRKLTEANPTQGHAKRGISEARDRVLTDEELVALWNFLESTETDLTPAIRKIIRLAILTGQRRTEIAGARVSEFDLDSTTPTWTIPGDSNAKGKLARGRTKNGKTQRVPLSRQAVELWREAIKEAGKNDYVFPADASRSKIGEPTRVPHIHGESVSKAMRRIRSQLGIADITVHDLRRTMATRLGDLRQRPDVIAKILNHQPRDVTGIHYNHSPLDELVRTALQAWANYVDEKVSGETTSNVVPIGLKVGGLVS